MEKGYGIVKLSSLQIHMLKVEHADCRGNVKSVGNNFCLAGFTGCMFAHCRGSHAKQ